MKFILIKFFRNKKISQRNKISINKDINLNFIKKGFSGINSINLILQI